MKSSSASVGPTVSPSTPRANTDSTSFPRVARLFKSSRPTPPLPRVTAPPCSEVSEFLPRSKGRSAWVMGDSVTDRRSYAYDNARRQSSREMAYNVALSVSSTSVEAKYA